jgi:hypothetical protein
VEKSLSSGVSTKVPTTSVRTQEPPPCFRRDWLLGLILILFVILAYTPTWKTGLVWDDETILTANPCIVGPLGLKEIWTTGAADICPLTLTTFWAEHALWGLNPLPKRRWKSTLTMRKPTKKVSSKRDDWIWL